MRRQQTGLMNGSQQRPSPGPLRVRGKFIVRYLNCIGPNNTGEEIEREAEIESRTQCSPLLGDLTRRPTQTPPKRYHSLACELPPLTLQISAARVSQHGCLKPECVLSHMQRGLLSFSSILKSGCFLLCDLGFSLADWVFRGWEILEERNIIQSPGPSRNCFLN